MSGRSRRKGPGGRPEPAECRSRMNGSAGGNGSGKETGPAAGPEKSAHGTMAEIPDGAPGVLGTGTSIHPRFVHDMLGSGCSYGLSFPAHPTRPYLREYLRKEHAPREPVPTGKAAARSLLPEKPGPLMPGCSRKPGPVTQRPEPARTQWTDAWQRVVAAEEMTVRVIRKMAGWRPAPREAGAPPGGIRRQGTGP